MFQIQPPPSRRSAVFFAATAALAMACSEPMLPPVAPKPSKPAVIDAKGQPALVETGVKRFDPKQQPRSAAEKAATLAKLKSGANFVDMALMPAVKVASQRVADEAVVTPKSVTLPLAGNEAMLKLQPGEVLVAGATQTGVRRHSAGDNIFGLLRKVKSVQQTGDSIVIATERPKLTEILAGQVSLSLDATQMQLIDTAGINLAAYVPGLVTVTSDELAAGLEPKKGAWGIDKDFDLLGSQVGGSKKFQFDNAVDLDGIEQDTKAEVLLTAKAGLAVGIHFGFDIDGLFKAINYVTVYGYGKAYGEAEFKLTANAEPLPKEVVEQVADEFFRKIGIDNPVKVKQLPEFSVGQLTYPGPGIPIGPIVIPTTFVADFVVTPEVKVSSTMSIDAAAGVKAEIKAGMEYTEKGGWAPVQEATFEKYAKFDMTQGQASVTVQVKVGPIFHWMIADVAGPYVDIRPGLRGTLQYAAWCPKEEETPPKTKFENNLGVLVEVGVAGEVGADVDLGDFFELPLFKIELFEYWWELFKKKWDLPPLPLDCPTLCNNGVQDGYEMDVDCGGWYCKGCAEGSKCSGNGPSKDCGEGLFCYGNDPFSKEQNGKCSTFNPVDPCNNNKLDDGELDVDCGGKCGKCKNGQLCSDDDNCASGLCNIATKKCGTWDCKNGIWDAGGETDIDCGGNCKGPPDNKTCGDGKVCGFDDDCTSGACLAVTDSGLCLPKACSSFANFKQDGDETDVNCGGPCVGQFFVDAKVCWKGQCGKDLLKCAKGKKCKADNDCASGNCIAETGTCGGDIGSDGVKDGTETDIDCGGASKAKCGHGKGCAADGDCDTQLQCVAGKCFSVDENGVQDAPLESDVDCGAGVPTKCGPGKKCLTDKDCLGQGLGDFGCKKPAFGPQVCMEKGNCANSQQDGLETGVDCGGECPNKCAEGSGCLVNGDCAAGTCNVLQIDATGATVKGVCTGLCSNAKLDPGEGDVDCGKACPKKCPLGAKCAQHADCAGNFCLTSTSKIVPWVCAVSKCDDFVLGGNETDIDCGGGCAACKKGQKCKADSDCESSNCTKGACGPKPCENGKLDPGETGIDCGGNCLPAQCPDGQGCETNGDCQWNICVAKVCKYDLCFNGKKDATEADVDCGGQCKAKCANGQPCAVQACPGTGQFCFYAAGCQSGSCKVDPPGLATSKSQCVAGPCFDGVLSPGEAGIDCGPACNNKCGDGKTCGTASDCQSGWCSGAGVCKTATCSDNALNQDETSQDCGGMVCPKCAPMHQCKVDGDCQSGSCQDAKPGEGVGKLCQFPLCTNGVLDTGEGDIDCGGPCPNKCGYGHKCQADSDCTTGQCLKKPTSWSAANICAVDACQNGKKDGNESDVDCGGPCPDKCAVGKACNNGNDCTDFNTCNWTTGAGCAAFCNIKTFKCVATMCEDGQQDGGEGDIDCGGPCAAKCALGKGCKSGDGCQSGYCNGQTYKCVASACEDKKLSAGEADIDCGGNCAAKCPLGKGCKAASDCQSNVCNGSACVSGSCFDLKKTDNEGDVDCGGACAAKCSTGKNCASGSDCTTGVCSIGGQCVLTTCDDGKLSGDESDVDCGGGCKTKCLLAAKCKGDGDCFSAACHSKNFVCVASGCFDAAKNKGETDVDCGGPCAPCLVGQGCALPSDCSSAACSVGGSCVKTTCEDGKLTPGETDIDCGGPCGATCGLGLACAATSDCAGTSACAGGKCGCLPGWSGTKCEIKSDVCVADQLNCDDANACTVDSCDPKKGCLHNGVPVEGQLCDDGDKCTAESKCQSGQCSMTKAQCPDDGNVCTLEACAASNGSCSSSAKACDDGNLCTDDSCNPSTGCVKTNNSAPCPDSDLCTTNEVCSGGVCTTAKVNCDDNNACTADSCGSGSGCAHNAQGDGTSCGGSQTCWGGTCCAASGAQGFLPKGTYQTMNLTACARWVEIYVEGAKGGQQCGYGAPGGAVRGLFSGMQGMSLSVIVGSAGSGNTGGWPNGGGASYNVDAQGGHGVAGGGGMSAVMAGNTYFAIGGGGGGDGTGCASGGRGGYPTGETGGNPGGYSVLGGGGGSQSAGGVGGIDASINGFSGEAGYGPNFNNPGMGGPGLGWGNSGGGGGGGGYYGGGGGSTMCSKYPYSGCLADGAPGSGGGGGSSYLSPSAKSPTYWNGNGNGYAIVNIKWWSSLNAPY